VQDRNVVVLAGVTVNLLLQNVSKECLLLHLCHQYQSIFIHQFDKLIAKYEYT